MSILLAVAGLGASAAAAGAKSGPQRLAALAPPPVPRGAFALGPVASSQPVSFEVVLRPRNQGAIDALLSRLYSPGSSDYEQWLPAGAFDQEYGPSPAAVSAALGWLRGLGLSAEVGPGFTIRATGTASRVRAGLGVQLQRYRLASGRSVFSNRSAPLVPSSVAPEVATVVGLNDLPVATPMATLLPAGSRVGTAASPDALAASGSCSAADSLASSNGGYTTTGIGAVYGVSTLQAAGLSGSGRTDAVFELAPSQASDYSTFFSCFGLSTSVQVDPVDGGGTPDAGGTSEADLDIEQLASQTPAARIISYEGPNTDQGVYDTTSAIVTQDSAKVISDSWGLCETLNPSSGMGSIASVDVLLEQAASQGQAIFAASGDTGSEACYGDDGDTSLEVEYPASNSWVTAVGGTARSLNGTEVVWNGCDGVQAGTACGPGGSGGGGVSRVEAREQWQSGLTEPASASCGANGSNCRLLPDVALNAGVPEAFYAEGSWGLYVGTSLGAPLAAGMWTDRAGGCTTTATGDASPALYLLAASGAVGQGFEDIASGDNDLTGNNGGQYGAGPGFDLASGLGAMLGPGLACTSVHNVSPAQGPAGTVVTVSGLGLENATLSLNGVPVTPLSQSATSIQIAMPQGTGTVTLSVEGPVAEGGNLQGTFTYGPPSGVFTRVAGNTALETAIAISQADYPNPGSAGAVVLARSDFFSDALAGGPLAAALHGPLLITPGAGLSATLDPEVLAEIERVLPSGGTVYILGGTLALSADIDGQLAGAGYKTVRLAGQDEFGTAVAVAEQLGNPTTVFEATGTDFPDALSAVAAAVVTHGAILLTNGSTQAPETATYLAAHQGDTRYAIGGQFAAAGADPSATAVYGETEYDTSAAVAARFFAAPTALGAATGAGFPDALAAGPGLGLAGAPLLLVPPAGALPASIYTYLESVAPKVVRGTLFGGVFAVSDQVLAELDGAG